MQLPDSLQFEQHVKDEDCSAMPLTAASAADVLDSIVNNCSATKVLFDLDSTLLNNRPRNAAIMREFAAHAAEPGLAQADQKHWVNWRADDAMAAMGMPPDKIAEHRTAYRDFWQARFFTSAYCQYDVPVDGAAEFVAAIAAAGGQVSYLTGRHEGMRKGTLESLATSGFPVPGQGDTALWMKPVQHDSDDTFKDSTASQLQQKCVISAAFDNEPLHINAFHSVLPDAVCVHLFTDHSMRGVQLDSSIPSIRNFIRK